MFIDLIEGTDTEVGLLFRVFLPGGGTVIADVGRLVFDAEGNLTFEAGPPRRFTATSPRSAPHSAKLRHADRSLVTEDRSAGGVRDQTGPGRAQPGRDFPPVTDHLRPGSADRQVADLSTVVSVLRACYESTWGD
jgi:hypothetical protein